MASKTTKGQAKKTVKVEMDAQALRNLLEAVDTRSQHASAWILASDNSSLRRKSRRA